MSEEQVFHGYVEDLIGNAVRDAIRELLSSKHLYQSTKLQETDLLTAAPRCFSRSANFLHPATVIKKALESALKDTRDVEQRKSMEEAASRLSGHWLLATEDREKRRSTSASSTYFDCPTVLTTCSICGDIQPFNSVPDLTVYHLDKANHTNQWFLFAYQCQKCKTTPVRFLVRRNGLKLTLCGRDPIELVNVPKYFPKAHSKHFSGAIVAHQSGQTLAGIFLLRVFIEQYWRAIPSVAATKGRLARPTGEEFGEAYKAILPKGFSKEFPTLLECYGRLSQAMHEADPSDEIFNECMEKIAVHFDALRLWKTSFC